MSGRGTVSISAEVLRDALHMPTGTRLVGASYDFVEDLLLLRVEHADLPGDMGDLRPSITHHRERYEWDWGVP